MLCIKETKSFVFSLVGRIKVYLIAMMLFPCYLSMQGTFSRQFKMEINQHQVNSYSATENFNILFSFTFVIFSLGQYYIPL